MKHGVRNLQILDETISFKSSAAVVRCSQMGRKLMREEGED